MRDGDTIGLYNADAVVSQFYVGVLGVKLSIGDADRVDVGDRLAFDTLVFPYRISLAAAYDTGQLHLET